VDGGNAAKAVIPIPQSYFNCLANIRHTSNIGERQLDTASMHPITALNKQ
jgi:hypothetical protein